MDTMRTTKEHTVKDMTKQVLNKKSLVLSLDNKPVENTIPIFKISGIGGHVISSQLIARGLSDKWKTYGLLHPVFRGYEYNTIEDNARLMAEQILESHPEGPYYLIGYSMGGLIAIEIARILKNSSHDARVVLLDTKPPNLPPLKPLIVRLPIYARWYAEKLYAQYFNKGKLDTKKKAIVTYEDHNSIPNLPKTIRKAFQLGREAVNNYVASYCPVNTVLVRSEEIAWWDNLRKWTPDYGWTEYVNLKAVIPCPGDHLDMIRADQYWKTTGEALEQALDMLHNNPDT